MDYIAFKAIEKKGQIMSKQISTTIVDTAISGVTAPTLTLPVLNYGTDFRVKSEKDNEVVLVNTTAGVEEDEQLRYGYSEITDVFRNSGISASSDVACKSGYSIVVQLTKNIRVTDSADASYGVSYPISAHLVLKVPKCEIITGPYLQTVVSRMLGGLYENGQIKIVALLKGAISPKGL